MLTNTITAAATLRTRSASPFVLPTGAASWQLAVSIPTNAAGVFGFAHGTSFHDATLMVIEPAQPVGADARVTTKQDRPPRGVPR